MPATYRLGLSLLYCNVGLNVCGLLGILLCNIIHRYCEFVIIYAYAALFVGVPLLVATSVLAPKGTFTATVATSKFYRRVYLASLGLALLIWLPPLVATLLG